MASAGRHKGKDVPRGCARFKDRGIDPRQRRYVSVSEGVIDLKRNPHFCFNALAR